MFYFIKISPVATLCFKRLSNWKHGLTDFPYFGKLMVTLIILNNFHKILSFENMLIDKFGRVITYLRISVTPNCNLKCIYCISKNAKKISSSEILSNEEIVRISKIAVSLGIKKIRLTGGEPLLRNGIVELVKDIKSIEGIEDLSLTTNGTLLEDYVLHLKEAGLKRINISLDTLDEEKFKIITGGKSFEKVMKGIDLAINAGFKPIKINVVIIRGINDNEIERFVEFGREKNLIIRFIEYMPISEKENFKEKFVPREEIEKRIFDFLKRENITEKGLHESNRCISYENLERVGIISSISHGFCERCNRLRLTSDGFLRSCLTKDMEVDLKDALRRGDNSKIEELFYKAVMLKPEKGNFLEKIKRDMSQIGG